MLPPYFFVTATDTAAGKTIVSAKLVSRARAEGRNVVGMKPICCGDRDDAEALQAVNGGTTTINEVNPIWFRTPAAPYTAAMIENRTVDVPLIVDAYQQLRSRHEGVVVEGVGGWRVPIARDYFIGDLVRELNLPVLVVVANRLGAINHTLLTLEAIRAASLSCIGLILNHPLPTTNGDVATTTNRAILEELTQLPILEEVPYSE